MGEFSSVLSGGRLFQHYLVDQFCKMEEEKLSCFLQNQQSLRGENYTALREMLGYWGGPNDESEALLSERLVVLPSTYIGGECYVSISHVVDFQLHCKCLVLQITGALLHLMYD